MLAAEILRKGRQVKVCIYYHCLLVDAECLVEGGPKGSILD